MDNFIKDSSVVQTLDGFQSRLDKKLDILQESISKLTNQFVHQEEENLEEENLEAECLTETILVEQAQLQPQEELKMELVKALEDLQDAPVNFWPWKKEEQISALITEESSGHETVEVPKKNVIKPNPIDLDTTVTAQDTKYPLPVAPSVDQVYILPSPAPQPTPATKPLPAAPPDSVFILPMPAAQPKPAAPAPKAKSNPLHVMQNFKELVASVHAFATTSKKMANAYIAWHSGWFWCGFGFGAPGPRHF